MSKPVFIIGCPRSGTTITLDIMASHGSFAWVSNLLNHFPAYPKISALNKIYNLPFIGRRLYQTNKKNIKILPRPVEPWDFWNMYLSNFQWERNGMIPPRRRTESDIKSDEISNIKYAVNSICKNQGKTRFLSKYTDFPRIKYLTQAFPDALFIHIIRDGRAVSSSYIEEIRKGNFSTWNEREWWISGWPRAWQEVYKQEYNFPLGFVAFQWKFFVNEIWEDAKHLNHNWSVS